jgi:hypothetical protein
MSLLEARRPVRSIPPSLPRRTRGGAVVACVVLAVAVGGLALASALTARHEEDKAAATAVRRATWQRAVAVPERRLAAAVASYLGDQSAWRGGTLPAAALVERTDDHRREMAAAEAGFAAARVPAGLIAARARAMDAAGLYGEAARLQQLALGDTGAVADKLAASATRLQALADRTYDRARLLVDPDVLVSKVDGIEVRRPAPLTTAELGSRVASEAAALRALHQDAARLEQISARMAPEQTTGEEQP